MCARAARKRRDCPPGGRPGRPGGAVRANFSRYFRTRSERPSIGVVHGEVRQVEEEGAVPALLDEVDGEVGQSVGEVLVFLPFDRQAPSSGRAESSRRAGSSRGSPAPARRTPGSVVRLRRRRGATCRIWPSGSPCSLNASASVSSSSGRGRQLLGAQHLLEGMLPAAGQPVRQAQSCRVLAGQE